MRKRGSVIGAAMRRENPPFWCTAKILSLLRDGPFAEYQPCVQDARASRPRPLQPYWTQTHERRQHA